MIKSFTMNQKHRCCLKIKTLHFRKPALWCFLAFLVMVSCNVQPEKPFSPANFQYKTQININVDSGYLPGMRILNFSDSAVDFRFSINNRFWFTPEEMLDYIKNLDADTLPGTDGLIAKAFSFVIQFTRHKSEIPLSKEYAFSPGIIMNSLGYGICSNRGAVLAIILKTLGYQSRCVQLGGHLVTEVTDNSKWKMLDADNDIYFLKNGEIASVEQISDENQKCTPVFGYNTLNFFNRLMPENYQHFFTTKENNVVEAWYMENIQWESTHFTLPPYSEIEIPATNPNVKKNAPYMFACLNIKRPYKGLLNIPLVIHSANGKGSFYNIYSSEKLSQKYFYAPGKYMIVADSIKLYFYINPFLFHGIPNTSSIMLTCNKPNFPTIIPLAYKYNYTPYQGMVRYEKILEERIGLYKKAFDLNPEFYHDTITLSAVEELTDLTQTFYKQTRDVKKTPDSIENKINSSVDVLKQYHFENTKVFKKMHLPFYRNIIMLMIIEFPTGELQNIFAFYFN